MKQLTSGENSVIEQQLIRVAIACTIKIEDESDLDVSAFLLSDSGKVSGDNDFIFYNQPSSTDGALKLTTEDYDHQYFDIHLDKIDDKVQKVAFVITSPVAFSQASKLSVAIENAMVFEPPTSDMKEKSLILAELYRHNGRWKFRALGQGFAGGLAPLATMYGVEIDDEPEEQESMAQVVATEKSVEPAKVEAAKAEPPEPATNRVNIEKSTVDLNKTGDKATISLAKGAKLTAKLQWESKADLDLYCFFVDGQGKEDKVYYRRLGDLSNPPYIKLLGDSQVAGEEVLEISRPEHIKYALICAYSAVSNGIGSFLSYKAKVVVTDNERQEVISHLAHKDPYSYWVAFALIDFTTPGSVAIENVETYSNKKEFAKQFELRTGEKPSSMFRKASGSVNGVNRYDPEKSPHLFKGGDFMMSVGEREFK